MESRACEAMRVRYEHLWTQEPSAGPSKALRQDLKSHISALDQAQASDSQAAALWRDTKPDIDILTDYDGRLSACFRDGSEPKQDLLDLDNSATSSDEAERQRVADLVKEIDDGIGRINKLARERSETLKDLKDKIQGDDVSHILLLHRRGTSFEPSLFAHELEKFKPFQQRVAQSIQLQQVALQEVSQKWKSLKGAASRGPGTRKYEEKERRRMEIVRRFARARESWVEVTEGIAKGIQFYQDLSHGSSALNASVMSFVKERDRERDELAGQAETKQRLASAPSASPPPPPRPPIPQKPASGLENAMNSMGIGSPPPPSSQRDPYSGWAATPNPPPRPQQSSQVSYASSPSPYSQPTPQRQSSMVSPPPPAPPSAPPADPYANMFGGGQGVLAHFSLEPQQAQSRPPPPPSAGPGAQQDYYGSRSPPPPPPSQNYGYSNPNQGHPSSFPPPPAQAQQQHYQPYSQPPQQHSAFPPPPPPINYQSQQPGGYQSPPPGGAGQFPGSYPYQQQQQQQPPQGYGNYR